MTIMKMIKAAFKKLSLACCNLIRVAEDGKKLVEQANVALDLLVNKELTELYILTGISPKRLMAIAEWYGLTYYELFDFYAYFDHLPYREHAIILRHFGVEYLITSVNKVMANLDLNQKD